MTYPPLLLMTRFQNSDDCTPPVTTWLNLRHLATSSPLWPVAAFLHSHDYVHDVFASFQPIGIHWFAYNHHIHLIATAKSHKIGSGHLGASTYDHHDLFLSFITVIIKDYLYLYSSCLLHVVWKLSVISDENSITILKGIIVNIIYTTGNCWYVKRQPE